MDIRITPYSHSVSAKKLSAATNGIINRNISPSVKSNYAIPFTQTKKPRSTNKQSFLILSKNNINKPALPLSTASNIAQASGITDKKGVLLYQQIERNKVLPGNYELINRFHLKT